LSHRTVTFTREELFQRVWSEPLLKLAAEIGVSDVGLAKACRRAEIPLPGRGHWAKLGKHRPPAPKLPKASAQAPETISFQVLAEPEARLPRPEKPSDATPIVVPATLEAPDPLIRATLKVLSKAKVYEGRLLTKGNTVLAVRISRTALDRAMLLLDTLIKACRAAGMPWTVTEKGTFVQCDGVELNVILRERFTKQEVKPEPRPQRAVRTSRWEPNYSTAYPSYEWFGTDELTFEIDTPVNGSPQRRWADTRTRRLECRLADIVQGLPIVAQGVKLLDAERERWRLEREEEERRRTENARRAEIERRRRLRLQALVVRASQAEQIRQLCDRLERARSGAEEVLPAPVAEWREWARRQADLLDPTSAGNDALFSLSVDLPEWFTGHGYTQPKPTWWSPQTD
jgi:hypothetical protein